MGIQDFTKLLERHQVQCLHQVPLAQFRGSRVAVDGDNVVYIHMFVATRDQIRSIDTSLPLDQLTQELQIAAEQRALQLVMERLLIYLQHQILPVVCFDTAPLPLKARINQQRQSRRQQQDDKLESAQAELNQITDPLLRDAGMGQYLKTLQYQIRPSHGFMQRLQGLLRGCGIPVLRAGDYLPVGDAEALCAHLCMPRADGPSLCAFAVTTDSDFHAYGGGLVQMDMTTRSIQGQTILADGSRLQTQEWQTLLTIRSLTSILQGLGLGFDAFQDLCILLGTDYNVRERGVGPAKVMPRLQSGQYVPNLEVRAIFNCTRVPLQLPPLTCQPILELSQLLQSEGLELLGPRLIPALRQLAQ